MSLVYIFKIRIQRHKIVVQRYAQCNKITGSQFYIKKQQKIAVVSTGVKAY